MSSSCMVRQYTFFHLLGVDDFYAILYIYICNDHRVSPGGSPLEMTFGLFFPLVEVLPAVVIHRKHGSEKIMDMKKHNQLIMLKSRTSKSYLIRCISFVHA